MEDDDRMQFIGELERAFGSAIYPNRFLVAAIGVAVLVGLGILARRRRWDLVARRHPGRATAIAAAALAVGLPLGWYLGSPLFISNTVNEPAPIVAASSEPSVSPEPERKPSAPPRTSPDAVPASSEPSPARSTTVERRGEFTGADEFHFGRGTARLIESQPGRFTVRLENFEVRNGPDLFVYLSPAADGYAEGAVEIAPLKADKGNQNYEVPAGTDIEAARSVVIWCKQFAVLFATAPLS